MNARMLIESSVPELRRETRSRVEEVIVCPNCDKVIGEKESFCDLADPTYETMVHGPCGGKFKFPEADRARANEFWASNSGK